MSDNEMDQPTTHSRPWEAGASDEQKQSLIEQLLHEDEQSGPTVDTASSTRYGCIAAIATGVILSLFCLISGTYILVTEKRKLGILVTLSSAGQETVTLAINVVLALCTDGMMFVHSASLRWALYREQRLEFNTNIRLFTSSKKFGPNKWYINVIALACLVLSYAASSVLFMSAPLLVYDPTRSHPPTLISATALVALGLGLIGQALIAIWCLVSSRNIPTWSSNPLNTALAVLQKGDLTHRPGRCMLSVHQKHAPNQPTDPMKRQGNMFGVQRIVRYIIAVMWILAVLAIAWPTAIAALLKSWAREAISYDAGPEAECWKFSFQWFPNSYGCYENQVTLALSPAMNDDLKYDLDFSYGTQTVLCVLFVCLIQASQTIALHCLELLVNLSRDEGVWRRAYSEKKEASGTQRATDPFRAAVSSWENIIQFISKAVMHWIIGQSLIPSIMEGDYDSSHPAIQFQMIYSRLFVYAILAVFLAAFGTYLASKRPQGNQPAALGNLQTLVDLIDDWKTDKNGRMWWGDKTESEDSEVRHAGTCYEKTELGPIRIAKYAGR
ncbi:hypothetical protein N7475_009459 [Penicillium sp. IBT 31633x]|nr:hypothetical protein N7475_009459 [Penicillium sp. IBT 31633x]